MPHWLIFDTIIVLFELLGSTIAYPNEVRLDHAVGLPALRLTAITVDCGLNDSCDIVTECHLKETGTKLAVL